MTYASHMLREMVKGVGGDEDTEGDELLWFVKTRLTSRSCGNATNLFTISLHLNITILMIEFDQNPRFNNFTDRNDCQPQVRRAQDIAQTLAEDFHWVLRSGDLPCR